MNRGFRGSTIEVVDHYNLDAILSVGYHVNSKNATAFRIWANKILKQYLLQGYAINERIASQKMDDKGIDSLIDSLAESIKKISKIIGQPTLGDDLISDARRKTSLARSKKDFLVESMCVAIKQLGKEFTLLA